MLFRFQFGNFIFILKDTYFFLLWSLQFLLVNGYSSGSNFFFYISFFWEDGQQTWLANFLSKTGWEKVAQLHGYSKMSFADLMTMKVEELGVLMDE